MFIGDGGTLMIGAILTMAIFQILSTDSPYKEMVEKDFGVVAFCLAVMCIPVFDTLRVMTERICRKVSPFKADKTHLHHLFLEHNLNHLQTTSIILSINLLIVGIWWGAWLLGASIDVQLYVVIVMGILSTFGLSYLLRKTKKNT
jgi:UDP-N-acetylmuramyl pentapeptide phosphotransferase/UDP-N-acetylglucosamine-1-phosphate transferase